MAYELDDDLTTCLGAAAAFALRRGHGVVRVEHLLIQITRSSRAALVWLARRRISSASFVDVLDARLGDEAPPSGYRGAGAGVTSALDPGLDDLFDRASRAWLFRRRVEARHVLHAFFESSEGASVARAAAHDVSSVVAFAHAAQAVASSRGHPRVLVDHAVFALLDHKRFAQAVQACGVDPDRARRDLSDRLASLRRAQRLAGLDDLVTLACLRANARPGGTPSERDVVVDMLRSRRARYALDAAQLDPYDLLYAYVHGVAPAEDDAAAGATAQRVEVAFENDDHTTMDHVVAVLESAFDMDDDAATATMLAVHARGRATVGAYPRDEALRRVERARAASRAELMPLRIVTRPAD